MFTHKTQPAQSLVLIAIALVGLIAITAVAVDSGNVFGERRKAQSAADDAALAGALALVNSHNTTDAVHAITQSSGNNFPDATVTVDEGAPFVGCDGAAVNITHIVTSADPTDSPNYYIQVMIRSNVKTYFGQVVGINQLDYCVQAIARAKPFLLVPPFFGNPVVGLNPNPTQNAFDDQSNAQYWDITGGGIFSNSKADDSHGNVTFQTPGTCATTVVTSNGFHCNPASQQPSQNNQNLLYNYPTAVNTPNQITPLLPRIPACDGIATANGSHTQVLPEAGKDGSVWSSFGNIGNFAPGLYCIADPGGNFHNDIIGVGVTFYLQATDFTMKLNGGGQLNISAPTGASDEYKGVLMFSDITPTPCTQNLEWRGNGSAHVSGTIFMPSACIDMRGNAIGDLYDSMIIGYNITSNGSAYVNIQYNPDNNWKYQQAPILELTK